MSTMGYVTTLTGAEDSASLSLDFGKQSYRVMEGGKLVSKKFSDLINFTRGSAGGRFNELGLYQATTVNQPRFDYDPITKLAKGLLIEEQRTNLVTHSDDLHKWSKAQLTTYPNEAIAPDGTLTATKVVSNTVAQWHIVYCSAVSVSGPGASYTCSVFAKAGEWDRVRIGFNDNTVFYGNSVFDLTNGTVVTGSTGTITPVGNGWYRITHTGVSLKAGSVAVAINPVKPGGLEAKTPGDGVSGIYLWGGQFENGLDTSYFQTPTNFTSRSSTATYFDKNGIMKVAGINVPRSGAYQYFDGGFKPIGLLTEPSATNRIKAPTNLSLTPWSRASGVFITDGSMAPDGTVSNRVNLRGINSHNINQVLDYVLLVGTTYTLSIWLRAVKGSFACQLAYYDNSVSLNSQGFTATSEWSRYSFSFTPTTTATSPQVRLVGFAIGADGDALDMWGCQLEVGPVATSFIPTTLAFTGRASTATYLDSQGSMQTAESGVVRDKAFKYDDSGVLRPAGQMLLESAATNLVGNSQDFEKWTNSGPGSTPLTVTPGATSGTRGAGTMTLVSRGDTGVRYLTTPISSPAKSTITRTQRVKAGNTATSWLSIRLQTSYSNRLDAWFNAATGECGGSVVGDVLLVAVSMTKEGGGVWLCSVTATAGEVAWGSTLMTSQDRAAAVDAGTTSLSEIYMDTVQVELGLTGTSYIPTLGSTATRAADVYGAYQATRAADIFTSVATTRAADVANSTLLAPWFNATSGTLSASIIPGPRLGGTRSVLNMDDGTQANRISLFDTQSGGAATPRFTINGTEHSPSDIAGVFVRDVTAKASIAWSVDLGVSASAGGKLSTNSVVTSVPKVNTIRFGSAPVGGLLNGHLQTTNFYPVRLANSQLQILTE